ncbi:membrane protein [Parapedobacter defluvii]|uniref:Membrane protein n=1 Tax=Parapedobacter defluvii TaxID=2045106 RepID=A0ABQ1KZ49_9SPHI|nr:PepSY-associated TM helix domain-containing protein [Parapedobacter defluvii]GGC14057.1 membrane protein [Parapedobacter defluvii]
MLSRLNGWLHLWLGIVTGLVVFIVSITGCIYVFTDELKAICYPDRLFVTPTNHTVQPLSVMLANVQEALGNEYEISRCDIHPAPNRSWTFRALDINPDGFGHWGYFRYNFRVYVNPYTAEVIHVENTNNEFFQLVLAVHTHLLLGHKIGQPIVAYSVLIFVFLLLSGLILWWPKKWTRKALKQSFQIKWRAKFKRVNYDLHNVLGFYTLIPALVLAGTGLVFSFTWVDQSLYFLFSGGQRKVERVVPVTMPPSTTSTSSLDRALNDVLQKYPKADMVSMRVRDKPTAPYDFQIRQLKSRTYYFEWSYYDRHTGKLLSSYGTDGLNGAERIRAMNFDLHVGSFLGLPGKILAFLASLVCASLPITGFLIWYNQKWGKKSQTTKIRRQNCP